MKNDMVREPFLIDPRHADYLLDQNAPLNDLRLTWTKRLIILFLLLASISMAVVEFVGGDSTWVEAQGQVLALEEEDAFADAYRVDFVFRDQSGEEYRLSDTVDAIMYNRLNVGGTVDLRYPHNEPYEVVVIDPVEVEKQRLSVNFFFVVVLMLVLAATVVAWIVLPERKNRRLERDGQLLAGTVTTCWPIKSGRRRGGYSIQLGYVFTTPSGKEIREQVVRMRDDLRGESLPGPGAPLKVLYVNDRLFRLM